MATGLIIAGVVAAVAAGASAYVASEQAAQQRRDQKRAADAAADAERAAGEARARQVRYDAEKKRQTIRTREAAAGVQIGQGSLLESEMQFAADADYAAQLAKYPHDLGANLKGYEGRLFGAQASRIKSMQALNTGLAVGGSAASSYGAYSRSQGSTLATGYGSERYDV
jgi:hypothetical protein